MSRCTNMVVKVMVVVLVLLVSFWLSLFLHLILVQILLPTKSFSWPAYLDLEPDYHHLSSGNLTAVVPLAISPTSDTHCILPPLLREDKKRHIKEGSMPVCSGDPLAAPALLTRGQRYSVIVELVLPDSRPNRHHPMLHVQVAMQDARFKEISISRRPLLVPYRSRVQRVASALLQVPSLLFVSAFPETHTIRTTVYDNYVDDPQRPARFVQVQLLRTVNLQVLSAHVHIHASFSGLRHLLHQHPLLCAVVSTLVNMTLLLAAVVVLYFRRLESVEQQRHRQLTKPAHLAAPQQLLRGDGKAQLCGDPAEPRPLCDVDSELLSPEQAEDVLKEPSVVSNDGEPSAEKNDDSFGKQQCSRRKRKFSPKEKHQSHFIEEVLPSEKEAPLHRRKVSFQDEANPPIEKKKDSLEVSEFHAVENDSLPVAKHSFSCKDTEDRSGSKNENCKSINGSASVVDDKLVNCSLEHRECSAGSIGLGKQMIDSGEKLADTMPLQALGVELIGSSKRESCEVGAEKTRLEAPGLSSAVMKVESSLLLTEVKEENCSSSPAEVEVVDCTLPPDVENVHCTPSPTEVTDVDCCSVTPPASPVSTTSNDSQSSSLGDFTVLK